jgi:hypothetical protein
MIQRLISNHTPSTMDDDQQHPSMGSFEMKDLEDMIQDPFFMFDADEKYIPPQKTNDISPDQIRKLFQSYFFKHSIVRQQTESCDYFIELCEANMRAANRVEQPASNFSKKKSYRGLWHKNPCFQPIFKISTTCAVS